MWLSEEQANPNYRQETYLNRPGSYVNVYSYALSLSMVEYQTAVLREDMEAAAEILPSIPKEHRNKIAAFLEGRGLKELALEVTTNNKVVSVCHYLVALP